MATTTKIADFTEHLGNGVHNLSTGSIRIALSNTAPGSEASNPTADGNGTLASVTQIAYTNYEDTLTVDRIAVVVGASIKVVTTVEYGGCTLVCSVIAHAVYAHVA